MLDSSSRPTISDKRSAKFYRLPRRQRIAPSFLSLVTVAVGVILQHAIVPWPVVGAELEHRGDVEDHDHAIVPSRTGDVTRCLTTSHPGSYLASLLSPCKAHARKEERGPTSGRRSTCVAARSSMDSVRQTTGEGVSMI